MIIIFRPDGDAIKYDVGGMQHGTFESLNESFDYMRALIEAGAEFLVVVPASAEQQKSPDCLSIVNAGRIHQFLIDFGGKSSLKLTDSISLNQ